MSVQRNEIFLIMIFFIFIAVYTDASMIKKDTIWSKKDSPYIIEEDLIIEKNAVLAIEPGVTIKFRENPGKTKIKLIVNGTLIAKGEKENLINFTSFFPKIGIWGGIIFNKTNGEKISIIEYCKIEFAANGIGCFSSSPRISNNIFLLNDIAIACEDWASPVISNNLIEKNGAFRTAIGGISCAVYSNPEIENNIIEKNNGYGIGVSVFSSPKIYNNKIRKNIGRGIVTLSMSSPSIINNELVLNSCCGIVAYQSSPIIIGNDIYENQGFNNQEKRAPGIAVGPGSAPFISNNFIHQNGSGIMTMFSYPTITQNIIKDNKTGNLFLFEDSNPIINYNHIEINKDIPSVAIKNIKEQINLNNNWWGTQDKQAISDSLKSLNRESPVEKIDFSNILDKKNLISEYNSISKDSPCPCSQTDNKNNPFNIFGDNILFNSYRDNNWEIYLTNKNGDMMKNLTNNQYHDLYPVFSPDGRKIVFSSKRTGNLDLFILELDTNLLTQITDTPTNEEFPAWSYDGKKIAFKQMENYTKQNYYIIDIDGKNRMPLEKEPDGYYNIFFLWMPIPKTENILKKSEQNYQQEIIDEVTGMKLVYVPQGEFLMGINEDESDSKPQHKVYTDAYYIGKFEVNQKEWNKIMSYNPSRFKGDDLPVDYVSWDDVQDFLKILREKSKKNYDLPTEAEWEKASRADSLTRYCFGDDPKDLDDYAWYYNNSGIQPHPVGKKKPNNWGIYDMYGNILEWCSDWYDEKYYSASQYKNPDGPAAGTLHILRGGSWLNYQPSANSYSRVRLIPKIKLNDVGFRCVLRINN